MNTIQAEVSFVGPHDVNGQPAVVIQLQVTGEAAQLLLEQLRQGAAVQLRYDPHQPAEPALG